MIIKSVFKKVFLIIPFFLYIAFYPICIGRAAMLKEEPKGVDTPSFFEFSGLSSRSIIIGDTIHIIWGGDNLYSAVHVDDSWDFHILEPSKIKEPLYPSLAIDKSYKLHISFYDAKDKQIKYATNKDGAWTVEAITPNINVGKYSFIAVDENSYIHVSYLDIANNTLNYVTNKEGEWISNPIDPDTVSGPIHSIAVDQNSCVHISYFNAINKDLKYATNLTDTNEWVNFTIDPNGNVGYYNSLAVDSNSMVHIAYYDATKTNLKYATNKKGDWDEQVIDSNNEVGQFPSIGLGFSDDVYISYVDMEEGTIKYTTNKSGEWEIHPVALCQNVYNETSIAVDSNNIPHICYFDYDYYELKHLAYYDGNWSIESVISCEDVGRYSSIAVDSSNNVHISYYSSLNQKIKYATKINNEWQTETIDQTTDFGGYSSIAINSAGKIIISSPDKYSDLKLQEKQYSQGDWTSITLDSNGTKGRSSLVIDLLENIHISYYNNSSNDLQYLYNRFGNWQTFTIDSSGDVGAFNSIATDVSGNIHVAYYDDTNANLKYATRAVGLFDSWEVSTIDAEGNVGKYNDIAVDSLGKIHISYYDDTNSNLLYIHNKDGDWKRVVLDPNGDMGKYSSIAVDSLDKIHISYYDAIEKDLKYTTNAGADWTTFTIDSEGEVGEYTSIAVDSLDDLHISYYDAGNRDLKYAHITLCPIVSMSPDLEEKEFGEINYDANAMEEVFTLSNTGTADLIIEAITITGNDPNNFQILEDNCSNNTLVPGESATFKVSFSHFQTTGEKNAHVSIPMNLDSPLNISLTGEVVVPVASVNPDAWDFHKVTYKIDSSEKTFEIENTGKGTLTINKLEVSIDPDEFKITEDNCSGVTLAQNDTATFKVIFHPLSLLPEDTREDEIVIETNDPNNSEITITLKGEVIVAEISVSPSTTRNFDKINYDEESIPQTFTLSNIGEGDLHIKSITIEGDNSSEFKITEDHASNKKISPNKEANFKVVFSPSSGGIKNAILVIESNDPNNSKIKIDLNGEAIVPVIFVSPDKKDFGEINYDVDSNSQTFIISNTGEGVLKLLSIELTEGSDFKIINDNPSGKTLEPDQNTIVEVIFSPSSGGEKQDTLKITSNDPVNSTIEISLSGMANIPDISVIPSVLDFGKISIDSFKTQQVTIKNMGAGDLSIKSILLKDAKNVDFFIKADNCKGKTFASGENDTVEVQFFPHSSGTKINRMVIEFNDPDEKNYEVPLKGICVRSFLNLDEDDPVCFISVIDKN